MKGQTPYGLFMNSCLQSNYKTPNPQTKFIIHICIKCENAFN